MLAYETMKQIIEPVMGVLGILIAPLWLYLILMSLQSGTTWGWPGGPTRAKRPFFFWLCLSAYLCLAIGFAVRGYSRL